jgi:DNA (cytosine-5)-methyltransferase 1
VAAWYNEIDSYAAQWLRNLIEAGHIAPGVVDERSIVDVRAEELAGFTQCHFFAGIGGWSLALRLAGWDDARPVWTGSCPCQPFSGAGKRRGFADERHLWPAWFRLIGECRPSRVYGEQVADVAALQWFDAVRADLEHARYACAAADLCAASVGAPHGRQRLYWMADADRVLASEPAGQWHRSGEASHAASTGRHPRPGTNPDARSTCASHSQWSDADWLLCSDERWRPVEPGTFPLAHGVRARLGRLRAYGNAIVPQLAARFIEATMDDITRT